MKTKQNVISKADLLKFSNANKTVLKHILSPLELCAWDNEYKPFTYKLDGVPINVSALDSMKFLDISKAKFDTFTLILYKTSNKIVGGNSKAVQLFLDSDITTYELPAYILNRLCYRYNCKTAYDVLKLGKQKIMATKGIGKTGVKTLTQFFKSNGCEKLF
jgi:hypothetical protein